MADEEIERRENQNQTYEALRYKQVLGWFILQMIYTFLGALLFILLEECYGNDEITDGNYKGIILYIERQDVLGREEKMKFKNVTKAYFQKALNPKGCEINHDNIAKWWSFTIVTCYTIGKKPF